MRKKSTKIVIMVLAAVLMLSFTSTAFAANFATVRNGSNGNHVIMCQWLLYTDLSGVPLSTVDGISGSTTTGNIKKYQSLHGLNSDGICGSGTWGSMSGHMYSRATAPISYTLGCGRQTS